MNGKQISGLRIEEIGADRQTDWDAVGQHSLLRDEVGYEYRDILPMDPGVLRVGTRADDTWLVSYENAAPVGRLYLERAVQADGSRTSILRDIAVVPRVRRKGVGRALLKEALRRLIEPGDVLTAETNLEDLVMHEFLTACGFSRLPAFGYGTWIHMDCPYRQKTLERVREVREAGIEITEETFESAEEWSKAVWDKPFRKEAPGFLQGRLEQTRRLAESGGCVLFARANGEHIGTVMGIARANTCSSGRYYRDPSTGVLLWIESFPGARRRGLATALVYHLMERFRSEGCRYFLYRGFGYGTPSHRVGMGMGTAYLRATCHWRKTSEQAS